MTLVERKSKPRFKETAKISMETEPTDMNNRYEQEENHHSPLQNVGVSINELKTFVNSQPKQKLDDLSILDAKNIILQYRKNEKSEIKAKEAEVYIIYNENMKILDFIDILIDHYSECSNTVLWIDLFSLPIEVLRSAIRKQSFFYDLIRLIRSFDKTLLVISNWRKNETLKNSWCLLESFYSFKFNHEFTIAMSKKEYENLLKTLMEDCDQVINALTNISIFYSKTYIKRDKETIIGLIETEMGLNEFNNIIIFHLENWLIDYLTKKIRH